MGGCLGWPPPGWLKFKLWSSQQSWGSSQDCTGKRKDESLNYFSCNSIPGITLHGKSTLESLSYLNDQKIRAKLMIPSKTYEWSSFGFNYLIFWTGNTFTGSDTRKWTANMVLPTFVLSPISSPWTVTSIFKKHTDIYTHTYSFSSFLHGQPMYILFYILIHITLTMSWNSFCISTWRRASLFFLQLYSIPLSGCVKICLTGSLRWGGHSVCFPSVAIKIL